MGGLLWSMWADLMLITIDSTHSSDIYVSVVNFGIKTCETRAIFNDLMFVGYVVLCVLWKREKYKTFRQTVDRRISCTHTLGASARAICLFVWWWCVFCVRITRAGGSQQYHMRIEVMWYVASRQFACARKRVNHVQSNRNYFEPCLIYTYHMSHSARPHCEYAWRIGVRTLHYTHTPLCPRERVWVRV